MPTTEVTQRAADVLGPAAIVALTAPQPPARLIVDPPLPGPLSEDRVYIQYRAVNLRILPVLDRKSTRLNSSHGYISYAVFCLKKKTIDSITRYDPVFSL